MQPAHEIAFGHGNGSRQERLSEILSNHKAGIWHYVAKAMGIEGKITDRVRQDFNRRMVEQHDVAVTEENIRSFVDSVFQNSGKFLADSVEEAFDEFTKYHPENREHVEGWKSNDSWKVNRRIVMPHWLEINYDGKIRASYNSRCDDAEKALCLIA